MSADINIKDKFSYYEELLVFKGNYEKYNFIQLYTRTSQTLEILKDETNLLTGIFFQDPQMQAFFEKFPEVLFIDATYKLNDLRLPLFVLMCVDGNGESEIIAF
jgi:zinc finger SWIM domain-containing protein 3